jgi:hypothetical protein
LGKKYQRGIRKQRRCEKGRKRKVKWKKAVKSVKIKTEETQIKVEGYVRCNITNIGEGENIIF